MSTRNKPDRRRNERKPPDAQGSGASRAESLAGEDDPRNKPYPLCCLVAKAAMDRSAQANSVAGPAPVDPSDLCNWCECYVRRRDAVQRRDPPLARIEELTEGMINAEVEAHSVRCWSHLKQLTAERHRRRRHATEKDHA